METKQVIVIRKDLNMRKGKMCAQAAHASMKVVLDEFHEIPFNEGYTSIKRNFRTNEPFYLWLTQLFTKIVVGCDSKEELLHLQSSANMHNIRNAIIEDSGLTEFHGEPTITALAIGPDESAKIDAITGHLKLL